MKRNVLDFMQRGFIACGLGPVVLAVIYLVLQQKAAVEVLTVDEVCRGIFSLSALAFIVGGMNVIYQIERLPLMAAIFIHGSVLYISYLGTYLINNWLKWGAIPILGFSCIFLLVYLIIWVVIYSVNKRNAEKLNEKLKQKQQITE